MRGLILFIALFISTSTFASITCSIKDFTLKVVPEGVGKALECKNIPVIKEDLEYFLDSWGICVNPELNDIIEAKGLLGTLCRYILPSVIDYAVDYTVPERWECKSDNFKDALSQIAVQQCSLLDIH